MPLEHLVYEITKRFSFSSSLSPLFGHCRKQQIAHPVRSYARVFSHKRWHGWRLFYASLHAFTHMLAIPAFLTAELTAFTAVWMLFNNCVRSPVAAGTLRCSASTNLVSVMQSESMMFFDAMIAAVSFWAERERTGVREGDCPGGDWNRFRGDALYKAPALVSRPRVIATAKAALVFEFPSSL